MRRLLATTVCLLSVVLGSGCGDESVDAPWGVSGGRVEGRVTSGGLAMEGYVRVSGVTSESQYNVDVGEDGNFALDLPEGDYVFSYTVRSFFESYSYAGGAVPIRFASPDTIPVTRALSPVRLDFFLGGLSLDLPLPSVDNGRSCAVTLHRRRMEADPPERDFHVTEYQDVESDTLHVEFPGLPPGEYRVEVKLGSGGEVLWMPGTGDEAAAAWYPVAVDSLTALVGSTDGHPARITGRVGGAWQALGFRQNPVISLVSQDSTVQILGVVTEDDGFFELDMTLPRPFKLGIVQGGLTNWLGGLTFAEATVLTPEAGQVLDVGEIRYSGLRLDYGWQTTVSDDAEVLLHSVAHAGVVACSTSPAASMPYLIVPNLPAGEYRVEVRPSGYSWGRTFWRPQWLDRVTEPEQAQVITIPEDGGVATVPLMLEQGATLLSSLTWPDSGGYGVLLLTSGGDDAILYAQYVFDFQTGLVFQGLPSGEYKLGYDPTPVDNWLGEPAAGAVLWYPGVAAWDQAATIAVADADTVSGLDFDLR